MDKNCEVIGYTPAPNHSHTKQKTGSKVVTLEQSFSTLSRKKGTQNQGSEYEVLCPSLHFGDCELAVFAPFATLALLNSGYLNESH
jgi:hypothetical protein